MKEIDLGIVKTCVFGDHLLIGLDKNWIKINNDKPLEFSAKFEKNQLVLSTTFPAKVDKTKEVI